MKKQIHGVMATLAILTISTFFISTVIAELFGNTDQIIYVKRAIVYGLFILIPAMGITVGTGHALAKNRKGILIEAKKRRIKFIGINAIIILVPSAFILDHLASLGIFNSLFVIVQVMELIAGATNIGLMVLMARDGLRLSNRLPVVRHVENVK